MIEKISKKTSIKKVIALNASLKGYLDMRNDRFNMTDMIFYTKRLHKTTYLLFECTNY